MERPLTRILVLAALAGVVVGGVAAFLSSKDISDVALRSERRTVNKDCRDDPPAGFDEISDRSYHAAAVILTVVAIAALVAAVASFRQQEVG
jgi:hypothetical protein